MREIKFRCWNKNSKKFVDLLGEEYDPYFRANGELTIVKKGAPLTDRYILMQYTGRKDKHGKEIYDGDLVSEHFENEMGSFSPDVGFVVWCDPCVAFHIRLKGQTEGEGYSIGTDCEVVGNIYENPDLLK